MYGVKAKALLPVGFSKHEVKSHSMRNSQIGRLDGLISTNKQGRSSHEGATDSRVNIRPKDGFLFSCVLLGSFAREHGGCWAANLPSGRAACRQTAAYCMISPIDSFGTSLRLFPQTWVKLSARLLKSNSLFENGCLTSQ